MKVIVGEKLGAAEFQDVRVHTATFKVCSQVARAPLSLRSHQLLHTRYHPRQKYLR